MSAFYNTEYLQAMEYTGYTINNTDNKLLFYLYKKAVRCLYCVVSTAVVIFLSIANVIEELKEINGKCPCETHDLNNKRDVIV